MTLAAYNGSRALVLGGSGFIGRWVARKLSDAQATVAVAVRDAAAFAGMAAAWGIRADVLAIDALDEASVIDVVENAAPDITFNLIGYGVDRGETEAAMMWRINRDLVRHLAAAVAARSPGQSPLGGRRVVHVGSALEYGLIDGLATESGATRPHTEYGRSKLAGTEALRDAAHETGLNAVTGRAFTVFGPGEHPGRLLPTIRRAAAGITDVHLSAGTQQRDFAYVEDVAEGLLRLGLSMGEPGEVVNVATGRMTSVRSFAEAAARALALPDDRLQFGAEPVRDDEMRISGVDVDRFWQRTGWNLPIELDEMLRRASSFEDGLARESQKSSP